MKKINRYAIQCAVFASLVVLTGCNDDDSVPVNNNQEEAESYSYLRVYHASPDAPAVNVLLNGEVALAGVDYAQSSGAIQVMSGNHTVQIDALLADGSSLTVLEATELTLSQDTEYNVVAIGKAALLGSGEVNAFGSQIVGRNALQPEGARIQVMHASPDAPEVDVYITAPGADLSSAMPFADNVSYTMATAAVEVDAGDYQIRITSPTDPSAVFFDSGTVNLPGGADWFAAAITNTGVGESPVDVLVDTGSTSLVVKDVNTGVALRVIHTISDAPGVDVWVNGIAPAADSPLYDLPYQGSTEYLGLATGEYSFTVSVNGSDPVVVVEALALSGELMAAQAYSALAIGHLGDSTDNDKLLLVVDENTRRIATEAKLRVIHASTLAGNVDIYLSADTTISDDDIQLADIPYEADTGPLSLMAGMAYVIVTATGDTAPAIGPVALPLAAGSLTTLVALNDPNSASGVSVISLDNE